MDKKYYLLNKYIIFFLSKHILFLIKDVLLNNFLLSFTITLSNKNVENNFFLNLNLSIKIESPFALLTNNIYHIYNIIVNTRLIFIYIRLKQF